MDSHITNLIQIGSFGDQIYGQYAHHANRDWYW
jgi:hypothetical protein